MSVFTRPDSAFYWIRFTISGQRVRESTGIVNFPENLDLANEYHDNRKSEIWKEIKARPKDIKVWQEAQVNWLKKPNTQAKKSLSTDKLRLKHLNKFLMYKPLDLINDELITEALGEKFKKAEDGSILQYQPTANRYIALVQTILNAAWKDGLHSRQILLTKYPELDKRIRWITESEAFALVRELRINAPHLANMCEFALATGLRESNVRLLKWSQIDLIRKHAWVYADETKGKRDGAIPLNDDAIRVLDRQSGVHDVWVFPYNGKPIRKCSTKAWAKAKKRANIEDFKWHDLRHTWASWHVQKGTPLARLMELGLWRSYDMVLKYAHFSSSHLIDDAERVNRDTPKLRVVK